MRGSAAYRSLNNGYWVPSPVVAVTWRRLGRHARKQSYPHQYSSNALVQELRNAAGFDKKSNPAQTSARSM